MYENIKNKPKAKKAGPRVNYSNFCNYFYMAIQTVW